MSVSSVVWSGSVVCLGGIYMFDVCMCLCCDRFILIVCISVFGI